MGATGSSTPGRTTDASSGAPTSTVTAPIPADLHPDVRAALGRSGIDELHVHQADALGRVRRPDDHHDGNGVGEVAVLQPADPRRAVRRPARPRAYLYPTKALAQDQARALHALGLRRQIRPAIYDGDTPRDQRTAIRRKSNLILTNPDMLHVGILPNHRAWGDVFANLAVVVVDEAHVYRGVFGSHVANVLRRLRRVAHRAYGTERASCWPARRSAARSRLAERLTGIEDFTLVDQDGSARRAAHHV